MRKYTLVAIQQTAVKSKVHELHIAYKWIGKKVVHWKPKLYDTVKTTKPTIVLLCQRCFFFFLLSPNNDTKAGVKKNRTQQKWWKKDKNKKWNDKNDGNKKRKSNAKAIT